MKVKVIGCGGIGVHLLDPLCRFLNYHKDFSESGDCEVTLIDGDKYEEHNRERQSFESFGNKAEETANRLKEEFPNIFFRVVTDYLGEDNIVLHLRESDVIFSCVDNHSARKLFSDHCEDLDDVLLISGGNDYHDGNVQIFHRKEGQNWSLPLTGRHTDAITGDEAFYHPEIEEPEDENPADAEEREAGCDVEQEHEPQLVFANNSAACHMMNMFYRYLEIGSFDFDELYFDCRSGKVRVVNRMGSERPSSLTKLEVA